MAKLAETIAKAEARGITLWIEEGKLKAAFPDGEKTQRVENWIRDNKSEILAYLADPYRDGLGLKWAIVNSRVLGEEIVIAKDGAVVPPTATEGRVVYYEGELRAFMAEKPTQEHIRLVHESKKVFGGTIEKEEGWI
jgi:hypothetical protein